MKIERWEEETDEDWAARLSEEITLANNTEICRYFVERDSYAEDGVIINYIGELGWTWKEHPEGPFKANQILEWKNKAERWDNYLESIKDTVPHVSLDDYEVLEDKLEAVKDILKIPDCKSSMNTPDIVLGFEEQFYLKSVLDSSEFTTNSEESK